MVASTTKNLPDQFLPIQPNTNAVCQVTDRLAKILFWPNSGLLAFIESGSSLTSTKSVHIASHNEFNDTKTNRGLLSKGEE